MPVTGNRFLFNSSTSSYDKSAEPSYESYAHSSSIGQQGRRYFTIKLSQSLSALRRHPANWPKTIYTHTQILIVLRAIQI